MSIELTRREALIALINAEEREIVNIHVDIETIDQQMNELTHRSLGLYKNIEYIKSNLQDYRCQLSKMAVEYE